MDSGVPLSCKGQDLVIAAFPQHPNLAYLISGAGGDRAQQLGVADRVVTAGMIAPDELADHYN
jgi:hypothetical protein